jgi:hypothetical protein
MSSARPNVEGPENMKVMANAKARRAREQRAAAGAGDQGRTSGPIAPGSWPFVVADGLALLAFVLVGLRNHHEATVAEAFWRNAIPLVVTWAAAAWLLGTYRRPSIAALVKTWLVAVPIAVVVRSVWVGSPTGGRLFVFLGVAMAFTLLFLLAGRSAIGLGRRLRRDR